MKYSVFLPYATYAQSVLILNYKVVDKQDRHKYVQTNLRHVANGHRREAFWSGRHLQMCTNLWMVVLIIVSRLRRSGSTAVPPRVSAFIFIAKKS